MDNILYKNHDIVGKRPVLKTDYLRPIVSSTHRHLILHGLNVIICKRRERSQKNIVRIRHDNINS